MIGMACRYDKRQHRIIHPRIERWIQRQVRDSKFRASLFMYYHRSHGTFIVARWVVPGRLFEDIINLEYSLSNFDKEMARQFRIQVRSPVGRRQLSRALIQKERDRISRLQQQNDKKVEYSEWKKQKYLENKLTVSLAGD